MAVLTTVEFNNISDALRQRVRPLKQDQSARYRLLSGMPVTRVDEKQGHIEEFGINNSYRIADTYTIVDPITGDSVRIANAVDTRTLQVGGAMVVEPNSQGILFQGLDLLVSGRDQARYLTMELHPWNRDNALGEAGRSGEPVFYRVEPEKTAKEKVAFQDRVHDATTLLRTLDTRDKQYIAERVGLSSQLDGDGGDSLLSSALYEYAGRNPNIILAAERKEGLRVQQLVRDLSAHNLVTFDTDTNTWRTVGTAEALFAPVAQAANANEALQNFFLFNESGKKIAAKYAAAVEELKAKDAKRNK